MLWYQSAKLSDFSVQLSTVLRRGIVLGLPLKEVKPTGAGGGFILTSIPKYFIGLPRQGTVL